MPFQIPAATSVVFACLVAGTVSVHARPTRYNITDLGPDTATSAGVAINPKGAVAGWHASHAALFGTDGTIIDLGTLGGRYSGASGINVYQVVVGSSDTGTSNVSHAFRYAKGKMTDLGTLSMSPTANSASGQINKAGQIVGSSDTDAGTYHAFLYEQGVMNDLGALPGFSNSGAAGINAVGHVVGGSYNGPIGAQHAFLYRDGKMSDLGTLSAQGASSDALAINDADQVVGMSTVIAGDFAPMVAFLYADGVMKNLGFARPTDASSVALGINNHGVVVGYSSTSDGISSVAFVYDGQTMADLNTRIASDSGWILSAAFDVNDKGEITGAGYHNGVYHAFLAKPKH